MVATNANLIRVSQNKVYNLDPGIGLSLYHTAEKRKSMENGPKLFIIMLEYGYKTAELKVYVSRRYIG